MARLTADAPCHPGHTLPLVAPVQQKVARESRRPLSYIKKAGMKGQGKVGRVEACPGMSGHVPAESRRQAREAGQQPSRPIRSRHGALGHQSPLSPHFLPYMGGPARAIKPFPALTDSTDSFSPADSPADSLCFTDPPRSLVYPPPGVLPESDRPIKGPEQRSIGMVPSSYGISYNKECSNSHKICIHLTH